MKTEIELPKKMTLTTLTPRDTWSTSTNARSGSTILNIAPSEPNFRIGRYWMAVATRAVNEAHIQTVGVSYKVSNKVHSRLAAGAHRGATSLLRRKVDEDIARIRVAPEKLKSLLRQPAQTIRQAPENVDDRDPTKLRPTRPEAWCGGRWKSSTSSAAARRTSQQAHIMLASLMASAGREGRRREERVRQINNQKAVQARRQLSARSRKASGRVSMQMTPVTLPEPEAETPVYKQSSISDVVPGLSDFEIWKQRQCLGR